MIRSLIQPAGMPAAAPANATAPHHVMLVKMGLQDDPEASVELCLWPTLHWVVRPTLLLSGEAQLTAQELPATNVLEYLDLKQAIL